MSAFECDANTILNINIEETHLETNDSIDRKIDELPINQANYLKNSFAFMIEQVRQMV